MNTIALTSTATQATLATESVGDVSVWKCREAGCSIHVVNSAYLIDPEVWRQVFVDDCKDHRYYEVVEETLGDQFEQKYFVIKNEATGEVTVQPFFFVEQDLLAGLPGKLRDTLVRIRRYMPGFLNLRMMMMGCVEGDGQIDCSEPWAIRALHRAVELYAKQEGVSIILFKAFPAKYRSTLQYFCENGYNRVPSMPGGELAIDFANFEEFMQNRLSRIFRKNLRRKFKKSSQSNITMEVVCDVTPVVDQVYDLYLQTYNRSDYKFEKLTKEYLCALGQRMPDRTRFFLWRRDGRIIAFALCMVHGETLCDMNVGMDYAVAFDLHLYFITLRDLLQWGAENGLKRYYTGPLNYDPKLHMRLDLSPLDIYARHASPWINPIFKVALKYLQPARHDPVLRQFRNIADLY